MKKLKFFSLLVLAISMANSAFAEAKKFNIDPNHATVTWHANHFGYSTPSGKFTDIKGVISFDEKEPTQSSVDATINIASLNTGLPKFDEHLKSKDFFNLDKFTTAKFISKKVIIKGKNKGQIIGDLTLLGVTKPVTLNVTFNKMAVNSYTQKDTIGFSATAAINRSDFGMNFGIPGVSDKVNLDIEIEGNI